jgi:hypothetical protein
MLAFKEIIGEDLKSIFFNELEFGDVHNINGIDMLIVLDGDELEKRKLGKMDDYTGGVYEGDLLFYVRADIYGKRPDIEQIITFDGEKYRVTDFQEDIGMYTVVVKKNISRQLGR